MTLSAYELNATYQKTQISYDAKITPVTNQTIEKNSKDEEFDEIDTNAPVIYTDPSSLTDPQQFQKLLMEKILGGFDLNKQDQSLFPNENIDLNKESYENKNPYNQNSNTLPQGFLYESSSEYYEKTTFDFNFEATIKTPNGEYNVEINFSYTREFYEKNETAIAVANENFKENPFEIMLDKDDDSLKDLKSLHFVFDVYNEQKNDEKNDIFEQIRELLAQRKEIFQEMLENKDNENNIKNKDNKEVIKGLDNFQIYQETNSQEMNLIAVQKDGVGIFLANSSSESSYMNLNVGENGYSFESSYSKTESSFAQIEVTE